MFSNIKTTNKGKCKSLLFGKSGAGNTLIEILLVIFMIALFSAILIPDFPKIKKKFALTRAVYKFAQNLKKVQDLGLSGVFYQSAQAKGYGVFINLNNTALLNKKYILYADRGDTPNQQYDYNDPDASIECSQQTGTQADCVLEIIDLAATEGGIIINNIYNVIGGQMISINFAPPNPNVAIVDLIPGSTTAEIIFATESDLSQTRTVSVNTSGLINVE